MTLKFYYIQCHIFVKYMITGKHIAKELIKIRDEDDIKLLQARSIKIIAKTKSWFDHE